MGISLILVSENNENLSLVLGALKAQTFKDFELILISDEYDENINNMINIYKKSMNIQNIIVDKKYNKSIKYNIGLLMRKYEIIGFLNDYTVYNENLLDNVYNSLLDKAKTIYAVNSYNYLMSSQNQKLTYNGAFNLITNDNYFINTTNSDILLFESELSTTARSISYVIRLLENSYVGEYSSQMLIASCGVDRKREYKEINNIIKREIKKGKITLIKSAIKSFFKGEE